MVGFHEMLLKMSIDELWVGTLRLHILLYWFTIGNFIKGISSSTIWLLSMSIKVMTDFTLHFPPMLTVFDWWQMASLQHALNILSKYELWRGWGLGFRLLHQFFGEKIRTGNFPHLGMMCPSAGSGKRTSFQLGGMKYDEKLYVVGFVAWRPVKST